MQNQRSFGDAISVARATNRADANGSNIQVVDLISMEGNETMVSDEDAAAGGERLTPTVEASWEPLQMPFLKCNCGAVLFNDFASYGLVVRNSVGSFIRAKTLFSFIHSRSGDIIS